MNKIHCISGLPRSGTTLLSTIFNQNPRFAASISSPLARMVRAIVSESHAQAGFRRQCPEEKRRRLIENLIATYYEDANEVVFDTNRGWPLLASLLHDLHPPAKMICCVREIPWILDSFEVLVRRNPYALTSLFTGNEGQDVYSRAGTLLRPEGVVGFALNGLKQVIYSRENKMILLVQYDDLCRSPKQVMQEIYRFIDEPYFEHDFNDLEASYDEFDDDLNLKGMHTVRKELQYVERTPVIPPDLWHQAAGLSFWKNKS
ncbi:MAG: sulfotransferase [Proteobacteria bacterium]|nr:sulfotransferase [Pseudomonadota bacterium]